MHVDCILYTVILILLPSQLKNVRGEDRKFSCERKLTCDSVFGSDRVTLSLQRFPGANSIQTLNDLLSQQESKTITRLINFTDSFLNLCQTRISNPMGLHYPRSVFLEQISDIKQF